MTRVRYIKVRTEFVLPVPGEIDEDLDAVAEAGLSLLRDLIVSNVSTMLPGTLHTSWQSMPQSWQPPRSARQIIIAEEVSPGFGHVVDSEERVTFVDQTEDIHVPHPWDQGLLIFPDDHPLHAVELEEFRKYQDASITEYKDQLKEQMRELTEGEGDGE